MALEKSGLAKQEKRDRLSIGAVAFTAVSVIIATSLLLTAYIQNVRENVVDRSSAYIESSVYTASGISSRYFSNRILVLENFADQFDGFSEEEIQLKLLRCCDSGLFTRAAFMRGDGSAVVSDGNELDAAYRSVVRDAFSGNSLILSSAETGKDRDVYAVPVKNGEDIVVGALVAGSAPADLASISHQSDFSILSGSFIVSESGSVLFADRECAFEAGDNMLSVLESTGHNVNELKTAVSRRDAQGSVRAVLSGKEYLITYASMDTQNWTFLQTTPIEPIIAASASGSMFAPLIALIIAMVAAFLALGVYMIYFTVRAHKKMREVLSESHRNFYEDSVTGFDSWQKFMEEYDDKLTNTSKGYALLSLDVDKFKEVNDTVGFEGGNEILKKIAHVLSRNIGMGDVFARSSADRFYLLVAYRDKEELIELMNRIISDVDYQITAIRIVISIGVYLITDRTVSVHTAADRADIARSSVKVHKESAYRFFEFSMLESIREEHFIENIMEAALERHEFMVYLQPKFSLDGENEVTGAEALVRWKHNGKLLSPGQFIPLFERNGFVTKLDFYMFREVCRLQKAWQNQGFAPKIISVNMSRAHLRNPEFVQDLVNFCKEYEIDPKYFEIEITESAAFENIDILMAVFKQIKEAGFHVSIDDFGTGYSSLNMLKDLPVDVLKIDRSFLTEDANESENASKIIGSVVSLATVLNISTICEGIETKEQANLLSKLGCNMAQGFFFARPMPIEDYEKLVYNLDSVKKAV